MPEAFLKLSASDRREALAMAAAASGRPLHLLDKDVWLVWILDVLFRDCGKTAFLSREGCCPFLPVQWPQSPIHDQRTDSRLPRQLDLRSGAFFIDLEAPTNGFWFFDAVPNKFLRRPGEAHFQARASRFIRIKPAPPNLRSTT